MNDLLSVMFSAMISENLALVYLLGMCTFIAVSKNVKTAIGLGLAVVVIETISVPLNHLLYEYLLRKGALAWAGVEHLDLSHLKFILFIGVIAAMAQVLEMVLDKYVPALHTALGVFLPLLTVNCAILGASLFMVQREYTFLESTVYGFSVGLGWAMAIILFATIRERIDERKVPEGLRGVGLAFVITGLLSMAFSGVSGAFS